MCPSVREYGDIRESEGYARGEACGEARGEARGIALGEARAEAKYQNALAERDAENARLRAELEKYKSAEKRN